VLGDGTVSDNVDFAKSAGRQLTLVTEVLPIAGLVAGLLCLAVGILLLLRRRRDRTETPAPEPQHAAT
jgi:LPXTG-motif cell wall-anchored protein